MLLSVLAPNAPKYNGTVQNTKVRAAAVRQMPIFEGVGTKKEVAADKDLDFRVASSSQATVPPTQFTGDITNPDLHIQLEVRS